MHILFFHQTKNTAWNIMIECILYIICSEQQAKSDDSFSVDNPKNALAWKFSKESQEELS